MTVLIPTAALVSIADEADAAADRALFARAWSQLQAVLAGPLPTELEVWATDLADASPRSTPLLGTAVRGPRYPALLWNGARCGDAAVLATALVLAAPDTSTADIITAVAAGLRVEDALTKTAPPGPARASLRTVACAVTASRLTAPDAELATTIDLAASLMVFESSADLPDVGRMSLIRAGHPVASAWLVTRLLVSGFTPMADALDATLAAAAAPAAIPDAATASDLINSLSSSMAS